MGHYIVPFIRCPYTQRANILPQIRFPRINGATKGTIICPSYYVSVSERDNILSPYALFICVKGIILCPLNFCSVSPRISQEGQYIAPFNIFSIVYLKGIIYCHPHARFAQKRCNKRDNIMSLLHTYSVKGTIILSPYTLFFR